MSNNFVYMDGELMPSSQAVINVLSVGAKYGANVFEGICVYSSTGGDVNLFRVTEHLDRLERSVRLMQIACDYSRDDYMRALADCLTGNAISGDAHLRLSIFITGEGIYDVRGPTSLVCSVAERPPSTLRDRRIRACISTWRRIDDNSMPPRIKAGANYHNSRFAMLEAQNSGCADALLLNAAGKLSESTNACLLMVRGGQLVTPPVTASILESVTRDTLMTLAQDELQLSVVERDIDRTEVYIADELLLCNSFQEVRPVTNVDGIQVGGGDVGPITSRLWEAYESAVRNTQSRHAGWLTPISRVPAK